MWFRLSVYICIKLMGKIIKVFRSFETGMFFLCEWLNLIFTLFFFYIISCVISPLFHKILFLASEKLFESICGWNTEKDSLLVLLTHFSWNMKHFYRLHLSVLILSEMQVIIALCRNKMVVFCYYSQSNCAQYKKYQSWTCQTSDEFLMNAQSGDGLCGPFTISVSFIDTERLTITHKSKQCIMVKARNICWKYGMHEWKCFSLTEDWEWLMQKGQILDRVWQASYSVREFQARAVLLIQLVYMCFYVQCKLKSKLIK